MTNIEHVGGTGKMVCLTVSEVRFLGYLDLLCHGVIQCQVQNNLFHISNC